MDETLSIKKTYDIFPNKLKSINLKALSQQASQTHGVPYKVSLFIVILFSVTVILEFLLGFGLRNFSLIVDSLHNILNLIALSFSLISTALSLLPENKRFTYGYSRLEMTAAFTNCCFLLFLSLFLALRGIHDLVESLEGKSHNHLSEENKSDLLIVFNILRLIINLFGCLVFREFSLLYPENASKSNEILKKVYKMLKLRNSNNQYAYQESSPHRPIQTNCGPSSHYVNFHSIYIHFMVGLVITGTFASIYYIESFSKFKIILAFGLLVYTIIKTKPVLTLSSNILLQALPSSHEHEIDQLLDETSKIEGIIQMNETRYWALSPNNLIIYLDLTLESHLLKSQVELQANEILQGYFNEILINVKVNQAKTEEQNM